MGLTPSTKNKLGYVLTQKGTELGIKFLFTITPKKYVLLAASGSQYSEMVHVRKGQ